VESVHDQRGREDEAGADLIPGSFRLKTKLLFICSRNRWRSPTAEALFKNHPLFSARSAGTSNSARIKVTAGHLAWADQIFCMERKHAELLRELHPEAMAGKPLVVLGIPDDYGFMDPVLIELLRDELAMHLPGFT
jgi:predicted protein tyrosine phosphatase